MVPLILPLVLFLVNLFAKQNRNHLFWHALLGLAISGFSAPTNTERRHQGDQNALWLSLHTYFSGDNARAYLEPGCSSLPL
jgi:hypothetical protein